MSELKLKIRSYFRKIDEENLNEIIKSYNEEVNSGNDSKGTYNKYSSEIKKTKIDGYKLSSFIFLVLSNLLVFYSLLNDIFYLYLDISLPYDAIDFAYLHTYQICIISIAVYFIFIIFRKIKIRTTKIHLFLTLLCFLIILATIYFGIACLGKLGEFF